MKLWIMLVTFLFIISCSSSSKKDSKSQQQEPQLERLTSFEGVQVTGITASEEGRVFVSFPRWRKNIPFSVVEILSNGTYRPYPNPQWNNPGQSAGSYSFNTVQSVYAQDGSLWVLDPSSPQMKGVEGNAKLYQFDLASNRLKRTYTFLKDTAPEKSYLNDIRINPLSKKAYITDSGLGAIVVLDLKTGESWRVLQNHESTKAEDMELEVEGEVWTMKGKPAEVHSDGIALSPDNQWLYYHALTGYRLYRVPTAMLSNSKIKEKEIEKQVEDLGKTTATDGMIFDQYGNLYMGDLENNSVVYRTPDGDMKTLIKDKKIKWPDTFTIKGQDLLFTDSLLHATKMGGSVDDMSFPVFSIPLPFEQRED